MRTLMRVSIPVEAGNAAVKSGRLQQQMQEVLGRDQRKREPASNLRALRVFSWFTSPDRFAMTRHAPL